MAGRDSFFKSVNLILEFEGGYVDDPGDPGGETKWGISKRAYPHLDIKNLTREDAIAIYEADYWEKAGCDRTPDLLATVLFDSAVNLGVRQAIRIFQKTLEVNVDGIFGIKTQAAAMKAMDHAEATLVNFLARRAVYYADLPTFFRFGYGWMRRLFKLQQGILLQKGETDVQD